MDDRSVERLAIALMIDAGIFPRMSDEEAEERFRRLDRAIAASREAARRKQYQTKLGTYLSRRDGR